MKKESEISEIYKQIRDKAREKGISLSKLCKSVGIHRATIEVWKRKVPESVETYLKIQEMLK